MDYDKIIADAEREYAAEFARIDSIALENQKKVLDAFISCRVSARHFAPSTGYGYGDDGRDKLSELFAAVFPIFSISTGQCVIWKLFLRKELKCSTRLS